MKNNENKLALAPFHSNWGLGSYNNRFGCLVDELFDSFWDSPAFQFERNWRPTDISEDENNYYINIELPGFKKSDINISVVNNTIKVLAKNNKSVYSRAFSISGWNTNKVKTKLENGVLTATIEKLPEAKEKVIHIEEVDDTKNLPPVAAGGKAEEKKEEKKK